MDGGRDWGYERGSCRDDWCVSGGGNALVPPSWRHAIVHGETGVRTVFVVRGARRDRAAAGSRRQRAGDSSPYWALPLNGLTRADTQRGNSWWPTRVSGFGRAVEGRDGGQKAEAGKACDSPAAAPLCERPPGRQDP